MTDYSKMDDNELNEAIFKAKGWAKVQQFTVAYIWQKTDWSPDRKTTTVTILNDVPDYTHDWRLAGELLEEMKGSFVDLMHVVDLNEWECSWVGDDGVPDTAFAPTPQRAICEAWLAWKEAE